MSSTRPGGVLNDENDKGSAGEWLFDPGQLGRKLKGHFNKGDGVASTPIGDAYAALTRDQWNTYVQTFIPIENKLIGYASDPGVVTAAMSSASQDVTGAFDAQQAGTDRRLRGMGINLDADEQRASNRSFGLAKSLADVGAQNNARDVTIQRQQNILGNPAPEAIRI